MFKQTINGFEMPPVNEAMRYTSKHEAIEKMGKAIPRIITSIAEAT